MSIFKSYDIRGKFPQELNEKTAFKIGSAFAKLIKGKKIIIGRDARKSSKKLKNSLIAGISQHNKKVIDTGLSTTPMFYFSINKLKGDGGVMITASHLPKEYNGFKFVKEKGKPITYESGLNKIEKMIEKEEYKEVKPKFSKKDIKKEYIEFFKKEKIEFGGKIAVDTSNGMTGLVIRDILKKLEIDFIPINLEIDCSFPNHKANPLVEKNLSQLKKVVKSEEVEAGVIFDGDGDRVGLMDENGNSIPGDLTTALIAKNLLKRKSGKILYDLRSSKIVPETIRENGGEPVKTRVGHSYIKRKMRKENGIFGGELTGHYYFKNFFYSEASILALMEILKLISSSNKKLSELIESLKKYYKTDEINYKIKNKKEKIKEIEEKFSNQKGAKISKLDGITVEFDDWWFNLRPSHTENLLRLNLEADTEKLMNRRLEEIEEIIKS